MRAFPVASVLFLSLSAFPFAAKAVSVTELPATIQSCITAGSCGVNFSSSYSSDKVSAFQIHDASTFGTGVSDWLMRYELVSPSSQTSTNIDFDTNEHTTNAFNGYLWMRVKGIYSAAEEAHPVTLFLDKVTPVPGSFYNQIDDLSLFMTTADLLAGGASSTLEDHGEYGYFGSGSLSGETPLICLAEGCRINAQLNLVRLNYQSFGSYGIVMTNFDVSDVRLGLFTKSVIFPRLY